MDPNLPLTSTEYEEWGDSRTSIGRQSILEWCPYQNLLSNSLPDQVPVPSILIANARNDPRVPCWSSLKWLKRLRLSSERQARTESGQFPLPSPWQTTLLEKPLLFVSDGIEGHLADDM